MRDGAGSSANFGRLTQPFGHLPGYVGGLQAVARRPVSVTAEQRQIGKATSHTWSPILKKYLVIASVHRGYEAKGTRLLLEHTVEFERRKVAATVVATPFYDPERKRKP